MAGLTPPETSGLAEWSGHAGGGREGTREINFSPFIIVRGGRNEETVNSIASNRDERIVLAPLKSFERIRLNFKI